MVQTQALLIVMAGRPGSGKSALAVQLCARLAAAHVRIDSIEQAIRDSNLLKSEIGPAGYFLAYRLAADILANGVSVVADSVNPVAESRAAWRGVAQTAGARLIDIEVTCSNEHEHRRRVETRTSDVSGLVKPNWAETMARDYEPWDRERIVIDTAIDSPERRVEAVLLKIGLTAVR